MTKGIKSFLKKKDGNRQKRQWSDPILIRLVQLKHDELILAGCKYDALWVDPSTSNPGCMIGGICGSPCSTLSAS